MRKTDLRFCLGYKSNNSALKTALPALLFSEGKCGTVFLPETLAFRLLKIAVAGMLGRFEVLLVSPHEPVNSVHDQHNSQPDPDLRIEHAYAFAARKK